MNYIMQGGDGKEYGPVSSEQIRLWFQEGRCDRETMLKEESGGEWRPLRNTIEFTDLLIQGQFRAPTESVITSIPVFAAPNAKPEWSSARVQLRDYHLDIANCIGRGVLLLRTQPGIVIGSFAVMLLILAALGAIPYVRYISVLFAGPLLGGLVRLYLKLIRSEPAVFADLFSGFHKTRVLPLLLASMVLMILVALGFALLVVPGVLLATSWIFAFQLVVDKRMELWPAMELSRKVTWRHFGMLSGFWLVLAAVKLTGFIACCIGILLTGPVAVAAWLYAYEDLVAKV